MAKKRLVIDASLARSAGETDSLASSRARHFLNAVLEICHRTIFTPAIRAEWDRHQSNFTRKWRVQMHSRKKIDVLPLAQNESLRKGLLKTVRNLTNPEEQASNERAIEKDCHLIEAALAADRIIASSDRKARNLFARGCQTVHEIQPIMWIMHDQEAMESLKAWLEDGAPDEMVRRLMHIAPESE